MNEPASGPARYVDVMSAETQIANLLYRYAEYMDTGDLDDFDYYRTYLAFARMTHWDEFLDAFINGG